MTVQTQYGDTKHESFESVTPVAVCGKCAGQGTYMLHPAYAVGHRVVGVCEKLTDHWLWKQMLGECNDPQKPCSGEVMSQCEKFMGGFGEYVKTDFPQGKMPSHHDMKYLPASKPVGFTCNRLYAYDFPASEARSYLATFGNGAVRYKCSGSIYRLVQAKISSCYSTNEDATDGQAMKCVDHKVMKSCHTLSIDLGDYPAPAARNDYVPQDHFEFCQQKFTKDRQNMYFASLDEGGVAIDDGQRGWKTCSEMDERTALALS